MTHLLLLRLGPVQDFIAQARRTRDLWLGSFLLSEVSRAAARALVRGGADLIFPALDRADPARLEPRHRPVDDGGNPAESIANQILALAHGDPAAAARAARDEAEEELRRRWELVRHKYGDLLEPAALAAAREQIDTLLEFHAAWAPCAGGDDYASARKAVEAALAARKTLYAFGPWSEQQRGVHKSSLDGARETILRGGPGARAGRGWKELRIGLREELDAVGLLKRAGGEPEQFVPVPTVGLAAWIEHASQVAPGALRELREACAQRPLTRVRRGDLAWLAGFPFDAQIVLPYRWWPYLKEQAQADGGPLDSRAARDEAQAFGERYVRPLLRCVAEPHPFVACLVADGDRMGELLNALAAHGPERHRAVSRALSRFAADARQIVERDHRGVLVYAGGDDVLAFVTLPDALACAGSLRRAFAQSIDLALDGLQGCEGIKRPTLSVGLGVGHVLESLARLLDLGRDAERLAKGDELPELALRRDALAIIVEKRGGQRLSARAPWGQGLKGQLVEDQANLAAGRLPLGKVYELAAMLRRLPDPGRAPEPAFASLLHHEACRILARAAAGTPLARTPSLTPAGVALRLRPDDYPASVAACRDWAERVQIAAFFAAATPRSNAERAPYTRELR